MPLKPGSHITVMVPAVPVVVPMALPGTCPRQIFFNGNTCPRYRRQSACGTGRVELSSTFQAIPVPHRVRTAQGKPGKPGKRDFFEKIQGKLREFSDHFYNLRENSGNFILPNISDQIGGALRINEASKRINGTHSPTIISLFVKLLYLAP